MQITTLLPEAEASASGVPALGAGVDYTWAVEQFYEALKLRKEAKQLRVRAEEFRRIDLKFSVPVVVGRGRWAASLPRTAGLYLVLNGEGDRLYVGAAAELRGRIERQLAPPRLRL